MNDRTDRDDDRKMPARADGERDDDDDAASVASSQSSSKSVEGRKLPTTPMNAPPTRSSSKRKQETSTSSSVASKKKKKVASSKKAKKAKRENRELRPAPYFYYRDHSREVDADPLTPLATTLSVPNFVTKLHAILLCDSLSDVIGWMPHGRSWKILKESEFEKRVLPTYFKQSSIASFYRQANGWGFRRMLKGTDKGSFYNERFIRGMPFLAKKMNRIGGVKVVDASINNEPMLSKISDEHPPPQELSKDSLDYAVLDTINRCIQEEGPKAKMPFVHGAMAQERPNDKTNSNKQEEQAEEETVPPQVPPSSVARAAPSNTSLSSLEHDSSDEANTTTNNPHTQDLLQQNQTHPNDQSNLNQATTPSQLQILNQNQQISSLLLQAILHERNRAATTPAHQHQAGQQKPQYSQASLPGTAISASDAAANIANILSLSGRTIPTIPTTTPQFAQAQTQAVASLLAYQQIPGPTAHQVQNPQNPQPRPQVQAAYQQQQPLNTTAIPQANFSNNLNRMSSTGLFQSAVAPTASPTPAATPLSSSSLQGPSVNNTLQAASLSANYDELLRQFSIYQAQQAAQNYASSMFNSALTNLAQGQMGQYAGLHQNQQTFIPQPNLPIQQSVASLFANLGAQQLSQFSQLQHPQQQELSTDQQSRQNQPQNQQQQNPRETRETPREEDDD